jgi:hypothetical protein
VEARKAHNRQDEAAKERAAMDALEGETWGRVVSLVDVHGTGAAAAAADKKAGGAGGGAAGGAHGSSAAAAEASAPADVSRMKDVLIQLKSKPLAPLPSAAQ